MFDIGFSELLVIGIVALVVIGPERLPKVARTVGHLLGRMQRYVNDVKSDINREMQLEELKRLQAQVVESARTLESSVRQELDAARSTFAGIGQDAQHALDALQDAPEAPAAPAPAATAEAESPAALPPAAPAAIRPRSIDQTTPVA